MSKAVQAEENPFLKYVQPQQAAPEENPFLKYVQPLDAPAPTQQSAPPIASVAVAPQSAAAKLPPLAQERPAPTPDIDQLLPLPKSADQPAPQAEDNPFLKYITSAVDAYRNQPRRTASANDSILTPFKDAITESMGDAQAGIDQIKSGASRFASSDPGSLDRLASAPEMLMGALGYATSPVTGTFRGIASIPVEKATGIPSQYTDTLAVGLMPEVLGKKATPAMETPIARAQAAEALKNPELPKTDIPIASGEGGQPPGGQPPGGTPLGQAPANRTPIAPPHPNIIYQAAKELEKILSPSTVDKYSRKAEAQVREGTGVAARDTEIFNTAVEQHREAMGNATPAEKLDFMRYVENRSQGATVAPVWKPLADVWRAKAQDVEVRLAAITRVAGMNFKADYFPHFWKDPNVAREFFNKTAREGRTGFTKKRTFEQVEDGLRAGLELKYDNPVDAMAAYVANAENFLTTEKIFQEARNARIVRYVNPSKIPRGWMPVKSRLGERFIPGTSVKRIAVAPEGWARRYNNHVSVGYQGALGNVMGTLRKTSNSLTALELSMSAYHAFTSAGEAMHNTLARAADQLSYGRPISAAKTLTQYPVAPITDYMAGAKAIREAKRPGTTDPRTARLVDIITRSGGRFGAVDKFYASSDRRGYLKGAANVAAALKVGEFGKAFHAAADVVKRTGKDIGADLTQNMGTRPVTGALQGVFRVVANALDTTMAPLFKDMIPKLKAGAAMKNLAAWVDAHPGASREETLAAGRRIWDSIDNRYGELEQDNSGYPKVAKETMQVVARSWSYFYGQYARELGGGVVDTAMTPYRIAKGKEAWTTKQSYLLTNLVHMAAQATVAGYLLTGQWPSEWMDLRAPKTGGTVDGLPERLAIPGSFKEIFNTYEEGIPQVVSRKAATLPTMFYEMLVNKDWKGQPIAPGNGSLGAKTQAYLDYIVDKLGPIGIKNALQGAKRGSKIGPAMSVLGFQPAAKRLSDLEKARHWQEKRDAAAWKKKLKYDRKDRESRQ